MLEYDKLVQLEKQEVIVSGVDVDTDVAPWYWITSEGTENYYWKNIWPVNGDLLGFSL